MTIEMPVSALVSIVLMIILTFIIMISNNAKLIETKAERDKIMLDYTRMTQLNMHLRSLLRDLDKKKNETYSFPEGTIQAVKEAMKRSHPDNGGNAKDFQMYKKAYDILTKKK